MRLIRWLAEFSFRRVISPLFPARFFSETYRSREVPECDDVSSLELVTHCWQYSHLFVFQLCSIYENPPNTFKLKVTVMYSEEDCETVALLELFGSRYCENVTLHPVAMPKEELFRRSIGRNRAAKATSADWVWFTDCDLIFGPRAFTTLALALGTTTAHLVFPQEVRVTELLKSDAPLLQTRKGPRSIFTENCFNQFKVRSPQKATGPLQIARGDTVRIIGYCDKLWFYQKPAKHWAKAYEDTAFRWTLNTAGTPLPVEDIFIIRHQEKGRYRRGSFKDQIRKYIRLVFS